MMVTRYNNSSRGNAGASAQAPQAPGAEPRSPRTVIRGESETGSVRLNGKVFGAFTDYLNVTFRLPRDWSDPEADFFDRFSKVAGSGLGVMQELRRGLHGYLYSYAFEHGGVRYAFGGQGNTAFLSLPGEGCALVSRWDQLTELLRDQFGARITRWDGAVDDLEGVHTVNEAVSLYLAGTFNCGGRKPSCEQKGNWIEPDGSGRTFYVGKRRNGKLLRVYEKGKQLGQRDSPWTRWEVELHNTDRVIPWDVLKDPARFVAGAYPALSWVTEIGDRIPTLRRTDSISYKHIVYFARLAYGRLVGTMLKREGSADAVVGKLSRPGVPERLALTEKLGMHEESDE